VSKVKIVLIDDEPDTIELMKAFLELYEFEVIGVTTGADGMQAINEHHPALLILDLMLPDIDGYELCETLRTQPETANLPIVMVTARTSWAEQRRGFQAGCDRYIRKPIDLNFLLDEIRAVLSERAPKGE
jgi:DNA-binding response OmpR family regulator